MDHTHAIKQRRHFTIPAHQDSSSSQPGEGSTTEQYTNVLYQWGLPQLLHLTLLRRLPNQNGQPDETTVPVPYLFIGIPSLRVRCHTTPHGSWQTLDAEEGRGGFPVHEVIAPPIHRRSRLSGTPTSFRCRCSRVQVSRNWLSLGDRPQHVGVTNKTYV